MAESGSDRGVWLLLGSIVVAVCGVALLVTTSGPRSVNAAGSGGPFAPGPPGSTQSPGHVSHLFSGRDPFAPFGQQTTTTPPTSPGQTPSGSPSTTPPSGSSGGSSSVQIGGHSVLLDDIFTANGVKKAQVEVDGVVYTVAVGQTFAGNFKLTSISGSCASFLFGDQSFRLCLTPHK